ncbi:MAG: STAS domain-containing protein [Clostridiales bacterium]|nr:STAS domain-containing protein [Clostridiales bacterium]
MEHERRRDTLTVYLSGELDHCCAQSIRRELDHLISDSSVRHLVLDMKQMGFMDSSGIGVILGRYRAMHQRGGTVSVKNMNPQVHRIFILSGMQQVIRIM